MTDVTEIMAERDAWKARALLAEKHRDENQRGWVEAQAEVERLKVRSQQHFDLYCAETKRHNYTCKIVNDSLALLTAFPEKEAHASLPGHIKLALELSNSERQAKIERGEMLVEAKARAERAELTADDRDYQHDRAERAEAYIIAMHGREVAREVLDAAKGGAK